MRKAVTQTQPQKPAPERPERPHKTLTRTQEEMADLASDLLLNGGAYDDVNLLLTALLRHQYRRYSFGGRSEYNSPEKQEQGAAQHAERRRPQHYMSLFTCWPKEAPIADGKPVLPKTVTEMVRANIRGSLEDAFDAFMTDSEGIEPCWLLNEILQDANNEGDLAKGIHYALDQSTVYVRVPLKHHERIEEFVEFLEKEAPRAA